MKKPAFLGTLYAGWMRIVGRFAFVQTLVILTIFYGLLIGPFGAGASLFRRDLLDKRPGRGSGTAWRDAEVEKPTLERAGNQF